jgi:uncharacterized protein YaiI (UPF0178 family)
MKIWVDADACPKVVREVIIRAAERTRIHCTFVANHGIPLPQRQHIHFLQVESGFDIADHAIVQRVQPGDLVITSDIPLAAEVIEKGCLVLTPRGERYTTDNIRQRLAMRDFLDTMRGSGLDTGGPAAFSHADRQAFANQFDRLLASF